MAMPDPQSQFYCGPFTKAEKDSLTGLVNKHLDDIKNPDFRKNLESSIAPDHWRTLDQIKGGGVGASVGGGAVGGQGSGQGQLGTQSHARDREQSSR